MTMGIKENTSGKIRNLGYSMFYGMLSLGYLMAGPFVDYIRAYMPEKVFTYDN
jgi:hypothetical protein